MSQMEMYRCGVCGRVVEAAEGAPPRCCETGMTPQGVDGRAASYSEVACSPEFSEGCKEPVE